MDRLLIIGVWLSVRRALASKLGCASDEITLIDFWRSAAGLRVAFVWSYGGAIEEEQATLSLSSDEADRIMWAVSR